MSSLTAARAVLLGALRRPPPQDAQDTWDAQDECRHIASRPRAQGPASVRVHEYNRVRLVRVLKCHRGSMTTALAASGNTADDVSWRRLRAKWSHSAADCIGAARSPLLQLEGTTAQGS